MFSSACRYMLNMHLHACRSGIGIKKQDVNLSPSLANMETDIHLFESFTVFLVYRPCLPNLLALRCFNSGNNIIFIDHMVKQHHIHLSYGETTAYSLITWWNNIIFIYHMVKQQHIHWSHGETTSYSFIIWWNNSIIIDHMVKQHHIHLSYGKTTAYSLITW